MSTVQGCEEKALSGGLTARGFHVKIDAIRARFYGSLCVDDRNACVTFAEETAGISLLFAGLSIAALGGKHRNRTYTKIPTFQFSALQFSDNYNFLTTLRGSHSFRLRKGKSNRKDAKNAKETSVNPCVLRGST